jgi:hypothetical protein
MANVVVFDEQSALSALASCLDSEAAPRIVLHGTWPQLDVTFRPGDGAVTPEIRHALHLVENAIYRAYALNRYGTIDLRVLTAQDRSQLAPQVVVRPGSTLVVLGLARAAAYFLRLSPNRMTGTQQTVVTLGLGALFTAAAAWGSWCYFNAEVEKEQARNQAQTDLAAIHLEMDREHTVQMRILARAIERDTSNTLRYVTSDFVPWRPALLEAVSATGSISIGDIGLTGNVAKAIAKNARAEAIKERKRHLGTNAPPAIQSGWVTEVVRERSLPAPPMRLGAV